MQRDTSLVSEYLRVLRRRKWILVFVPVLVTATVVGLAAREQKLYEATAEVLLSQQNLAASLTGIGESAYQDPFRLARTQARLAETPTVARRTLAAAGLGNRSPHELLDRSDVLVQQDTDLLLFRVRDPVPVTAVRLASEYARQFKLYRRELDTAAIARARDEVGGRIRALENAGRTDTPLYATLVDKEQQLRTLEALQTSNAFVVRAADSARRVQPLTKRSGVLAFIAGVLLAVMLAFLRESVDTRVRSAGEVSDRLGLPLLARIPEPPRKLRGNKQLAMLDDAQSIHAEAFRMLRTNFAFATLKREHRTIMVTSATQEEGKSTTAANLGVALARAGKRVVVVDLDMRRPALARMFGIRERPGLTDVALGEASIDDALVPVALTDVSQNGARPTATSARGLRPRGTLAVVPSGSTPPDPGEFIATGAPAAILDELRARADVILIDAPPVLRVGDAASLCARVDALIIVARLDTLRRPMLAELERLLTAYPCAKLGVVATGADRDDGYAYEGYHYLERQAQPAEQSRA